MHRYTTSHCIIQLNAALHYITLLYITFHLHLHLHIYIYIYIYNHIDIDIYGYLTLHYIILHYIAV